MKKKNSNNKLESAYNKVFKVVKKLDANEMNILLDAVCSGWEAWHSLGALEKNTPPEKKDAIDVINDDLENKTRKKK